MTRKDLLKNRFIDKNTRLISDIIRKCKIQNADGLIIVIDSKIALVLILLEFVEKPF